MPRLEYHFRVYNTADGSTFVSIFPNIIEWEKLLCNVHVQKRPWKRLWKKRENEREIRREREREKERETR